MSFWKRDVPVESKLYKVVLDDIVIVQKKQAELEVQVEALRARMQKLDGRFSKHIGDEQDNEAPTGLSSLNPFKV